MPSLKPAAGDFILPMLAAGAGKCCGPNGVRTAERYWWAFFIFGALFCVLF